MNFKKVVTVNYSLPKKNFMHDLSDRLQLSIWLQKLCIEKFESNNQYILYLRESRILPVYDDRHVREPR